MDPVLNRSDVQPSFVRLPASGVIASNGRWLPPVRGGENVGGAPAAAGDAGGDEGGQGGEGLGLYDLSAAPEHLRPHLEPELKKIEANVTRKLMEHADYRQRWEPFESIEGLTDVPADELSELIEFRQVLGDEEAFKNWWVGIGNELGLMSEAPGEEPGAEGDGLEDDDPRIAALESTIGQLQQELKGLKDGEAQRSQADRIKEEEGKVQSELDSLHDHPDFPKGEDGQPDDQIVARLALQYADEPDAIQKGFEDYLRITGKAQGELVDDKLNQPTAATNGGRADTQPEEVKGFDEAARAAKARLAAVR